MNKQFVISSVVLTVAALMLGFVVHAVLLQADYVALPNIFRGESDSQEHFAFMIIAHLMMGIGLTWIYRMGHQPDKPVVVQGLRFGAAIAVAFTIPTYLIYFAVERLPASLVEKQIALDTVAILLVGVLAAWLNKTRP
ncbi:MAG: hypothetical protein ABI905_03795 [Betaproteobacteria bacterium]